jgi:hypothetical protein
MASNIKVVCPHCEKQVSVKAELEGKKIRCKACGTVFTVTAAAARKESQAKEKDAKPGEIKKSPDASAPASQRTAETDEDGGPIGLTSVSLAPRCPLCANDLESADAIICLSCGFNLRTRETHKMKKIHATTQEDHFMWLLPGILCIVGVFAMLVVWLFFHFFLPKIIFGEKWNAVLDLPEIDGSRRKAAGNDRLGNDSFWSWLFHPGCEIWIIIAFVAASAYCIKFAVLRLILHPTPPEREKN